MNGSLHSCLTGSGKATIQETERIKILAGIAEGMQYLGTLSFVHRDLACRNVLLDVKKAPRVSDFGMSRKMSSTDVYASVNTKVSAALSAHCPLSSESSSVASVGSRDLTHRISTRQCFGACFSASPSRAIALPPNVLTPNPDNAHGMPLPTPPKVLPLRWTSPEALETKMFSAASDVFSFGIVAVEVYTDGAMPYGRWDDAEVVRQVRGGYKIRRPEHCPYVAVGLNRVERWVGEEEEERTGRRERGRERREIPAV